MNCKPFKSLAGAAQSERIFGYKYPASDNVRRVQAKDARRTMREKL
jgi:hypothetical protein